MISKSVV